MVRMKETIDGQRDELRQLNGEVQSQKREVDAVSTRSLCPKAAYQRCSLKKYSENMQQIYRRTPIPKCDFNKVAAYFQKSFS